MEMVELVRVNKTITIEKQIFEKLKKEDNASRLIEKLLIKNWGYSDGKINELESKISELQEQLNVLLKNKLQHEREMEEQEQAKIRIVKENEYDKSLNQCLERFALKDRDLSNAVYFRFREVKDKLKQKELRKNCFEEALSNKDLYDELIKEYEVNKND